MYKMRNKQGKLEKFVRGSFHLGKYLAPGIAALSLTGCGDIPKPISVSDDGRYVAYASTESGTVYSLKEGGYNFNNNPYAGTTMNLSLVIYDSVNNSLLHNYNLTLPPLMLTNSRDSAAYIIPGEGDFTDIILLNEGKEKIIRMASFPVLSKAGDCLAYSVWIEKAPPELWLDYFKTGNVKNTNERGIPMDFSPDLKKLLYIDIGESSNNEPPSMKNAYFSYYDLVAGTSHKMAPFLERGKGLPYYPEWIDNERILYQSTPENSTSESDSEIYSIDLKGNRIRITDNSLEEFAPQISPNGEIFYTSLPEEKECSVYFARTEKGFWENHRTFLTAQWIKIAGDNLIYAKNNGQLYQIPLIDVIEGKEENIKDITKNVRISIETQKRLRNFIESFIGSKK